jgi:hypothetical protein
VFEKTSTVKDEPVIINIPGPEEWPITHLRNCCKKNKVKGYTKMTREELVVEVRKIISNDKFGEE